MQTTRGKFNITIDTDGLSYVDYSGYTVATCSHAQQEFKLTTFSNLVPVSLLGEFGEVVTEATRLLREAREAVATAPEAAPYKFSDNPHYEKAATLLTDLAKGAEAQGRRTVFLADGPHGFFGILRNGEWTFHQWCDGGGTQPWGTLAKNTNPQHSGLSWLSNLKAACVSDRQFNGFSDSWARYDGKTTVYRYIPVDDGYVAFPFKDGEFRMFGDSVAPDKMESPFVWGEKNDGWVLESERSITSYADEIRAYLASSSPSAPLEYCVVTNDTINVDLGSGNLATIRSFGYVTYNPNTDSYQYRYFRPDSHFSKNHAYYKAYLLGNRRETVYINDDGTLRSYDPTLGVIDEFARG